MNSQHDDRTAPTGALDRERKVAARVAYEASICSMMKPDVTRYPHVFEGAAYHLLTQAPLTSSGHPRDVAELIDAAGKAYHAETRGLLTSIEWDQAVEALVSFGLLVPWTIDFDDGQPPLTVGYTRSESDGEGGPRG